MEGEDIGTALQDAALMTALHGMGYKKGMTDPKKKIGNDEAYKMSAETFNNYLGEVVPTIKKGETVPDVLKLDIPKIETARQQYKNDYPYDQRFSDTPITTDVEAIDFIESAAKRKLGNIIAKSNGSIPVENIKKEMTRIVTAKNQLFNQTLPPKERAKKEWEDLVSMGERLKPQIGSEKMRGATNTTSLIKDVPFEIDNTPVENTTGKTFNQGVLPSTGYGENIDPVSKSTINDLANNPNNFSNKVYIVKDPETTSIMRFIESEQIAKGDTPNVGNPDSALRIFVKEKTPQGEIIRPAGYIPRERSFDIKENNLNKTYYEITNRIRHTIETAKTPEELKIALGEDKAVISIDNTTANKLFETKGKDLSDEALYEVLKPGNAYEKYSSDLNNVNISKQMDENGINVLVADIDKAWPIGGGPNRANPDNPYLTIKLDDQNWLKSIELKNGVKTPDITKTISSFKQPEIVEKPTVLTPETLSEMPVNDKPMSSDAFKEVGSTPTPPPVFEAPKNTLNSKNVVETLKTKFPQINAPKSSILDKIKDKVSTEELSKLKEKEARYNELNKAVSERYLTYKERNELSDLGQELNSSLSEGGIIKPLKIKKGYIDYSKLTAKNKQALLDNALNNAEGEMAMLRSKKATGDPESFKEALLGTTKGSKAIITSNKLNLSEYEQRDLNKIFDKRVNELVQSNVDNAFDGTTDLAGREYSTKYHGFFGRDINTETFTLTSPKKLEDKLSYLKEEVEKDIYSESEKKIIQEQIKETAKKIVKAIETKKELNKTPDQKLAEQYGLKLKDDGYLVLDKNKNPSFSDEFLQDHPSWIGKSPLKFYGSILEKDLKINDKLKTIYSEEYAKGLDIMSKAPTVYSDWAKMIKKGINKIVVDPQEKWMKDLMGGKAEKSFTLNSMMAPNSLANKNLFETINTKGHDISQSLKRVIAQVKGVSEKDLKKIDDEIKEQESIAELARSNREMGGKAEWQEELSNDSGISPENGGSKSDIKGMSISDDFQKEKIQDLTNFEIKFPSFLYEIQTGEIPPKEAVANDAIRYLKDFLSNYNKKIKKGSRTSKIYINENEAYQWIKNKETGGNEKKKLFKGWNELKELLQNEPN